MYNIALKTFYEMEWNNVHWYEANITVMEPVTEAKHYALDNVRRDPSKKNSNTLRAANILRAARNKAQQTARRCANKYWLQLCQSIQMSSHTGNIRGMYDGIKKATGPYAKKTAPLKTKTGEVSTDYNKQMERWVEHYLVQYSREYTVTKEALGTITSLLVKEELENEPTVEELGKAVDSLASGKAPGNDGILPYLLLHLHELLCLCWKEGAVPWDMRNANIVTLYKNKS